MSLALTVLLAGAAPPKARFTKLKVPVLAPADTAIGLREIEATVGDTTVKAIALATPVDDLIVMLVLDLTDDLTVAERAKSALLSEVEQLTPQVHVAVLRAQDGLRVIQDPTSDADSVKAAIASVNATGRAGLLDSIETTAVIADSVLMKSAVRVAVVYVTDSDVKNYREDFSNPVINSSDAGDLSRKFPEALIQEKISKVAANLNRRRTPMFIVHTSYRSDRLNEAYLNGLRQLAFTTGGMAVVCRSNAEIPAAIRDVLATIRNHYSVTLELPGVQTRPVDVRLVFGGPDGMRPEMAYRSRFGFQ